MKPGPRALVSYVAGAIATGRNGSNIYDYSQGGYRQISGLVTPTSVNIFDYSDSCYFTGTGVGSREVGVNLSLYHYGQGAHINLNVQGTQFNGYDYGSGNYFSGHIAGNAVSLYDYGTGQYHNYLI